MLLFICAKPSQSRDRYHFAKQVGYDAATNNEPLPSYFVDSKFLTDAFADGCLIDKADHAITMKDTIL
jgi:hypothetical protein